MINISNMVFDTVYNAVAVSSHSDADVTDLPDDRFAKPKAVVVHEVNNVPVRDTATDDNAENHARISYEIRVYVNLLDDPKTTADELFEVTDTAMQGMKFYRTMMRRYPSEDRTRYRIIGRYEVIVRAPVTIGQDTVYQMYRR